MGYSVLQGTHDAVELVTILCSAVGVFIFINHEVGFIISRSDEPPNHPSCVQSSRPLTWSLSSLAAPYSAVAYVPLLRHLLVLFQVHSWS